MIQINSELKECGNANYVSREFPYYLYPSLTTDTHTDTRAVAMTSVTVLDRNGFKQHFNTV